MMFPFFLQGIAFVLFVKIQPLACAADKSALPLYLLLFQEFCIIFYISREFLHFDLTNAANFVMVLFAALHFILWKNKFLTKSRFLPAAHMTILTVAANIMTQDPSYISAFSIFHWRVHCPSFMLHTSLQI